jgi:DNA-binding NarL/FixJ family response regulator
MSKIRLVFADDQPLVLEAFCALLEPDFDLVGTATTSQELLDVCERTRPDVVVLDATVRLLAGMHLSRFHAVAPDTRLVFLTPGDGAAAAQARRAGAGVVLTTADAEELRRVIRMSVQPRSAPINPLERPRKVVRDRALPGLTPRQLEVLGLLADGRSMKEVAAILDVTPRTIAFHKYKMMGQLNVATTAELVQFAVTNGVVSR